MVTNKSAKSPFSLSEHDVSAEVNPYQHSTLRRNAYQSIMIFLQIFSALGKILRQPELTVSGAPKSESYGRTEYPVRTMSYSVSRTPDTTKRIAEMAIRMSSTVGHACCRDLLRI